MKPILHTFSSGGSEHGITTYLKYLQCPKAATLSRLHRDPNDNSWMENYSAAAVGVIGHALMEQHYNQAKGSVRKWLTQAPDVAIRYSDDIDDRARVEAESAFVAWRKLCPELDILGTVRETELPLPEVEAHNEPMEKAVGITPFTVRIDLLTKMAQSQILRLKDRLDIDGEVGKLVPGYWLWDYKFYGRNAANLVDRSLRSLQFAAYTLAYNACYPKSKAKGMCQLTIIRTKVPQIKVTVVPVPDEVTTNRLHTAMKVVAETINERMNEARPTDTNCFPWGGHCKWMKEGLCNQM